MTPHAGGLHTRAQVPQRAHPGGAAARRHERGALQFLARQPRLPPGTVADPLLLLKHQLMHVRTPCRGKYGRGFRALQLFCSPFGQISCSAPTLCRHCCAPLRPQSGKRQIKLRPAPEQETLDALRQAMKNTGIMCAVMLDTKVRRTRPITPCRLCVSCHQASLLICPGKLGS